MENKSTFLLKDHGYRNLLLSQLFNSIAQIFLQVTLMVEVYERTNSAFGAASVIGVMSISSFVSGMLASRIIGKYKLRNIISISSWIRAIVTMLIGLILFISFPYSTIFLFTLLILYSFVTAWYQPARFAILPLIVEKGLYMKANGLLVMIQQTIMTIGWAVGGLINVILPYPVLLGIISGMFILSGFFAFMMNVKEKLTKKTIKSAWKKVWTIPIVRSITLMDTIEGVANSIWTSALLLSFTYVVLNEGPEVWGFINSAYFIGAILGGLLVTWKSKILEQRIGVMIGLSGVSMGILTLFFSLNEHTIFTLFICILMGPMYQVRDIGQESLLQNVIPENERASIMSARMAFLTPWSGVMVMVVGLLADMIGVQIIYITAGVIYIFASFIAFHQKSLREYRLNENDEQQKIVTK